MIGWFIGFAAIFALWSPLFWILCGVSAILLIACAANEKPLTALLLTAAVVTTLSLGNAFHPIQFVMDHWVWATAAAFLYFPIGAMYMVARWRAYASARRDKYNELKRGFLRNRNIDVEGIEDADLRLPDHLVRSWSEYLANNSSALYPDRAQHVTSVNTAVKDVTPAIGQHKAKCTGWMIQWPLYLLWNVVGDSVELLWKGIKRVANNIWLRMRTWMQSIANSQFESAADDFREVPPEAPPASPSTGNVDNGGSSNGGRRVDGVRSAFRD